MSPEGLARLESLARHSVSLVLANQAPSGAYVASPTFPVYRFSWFRDGAFIADAMSRAGQPASAERFFAWCSRVLEDRATKVDSLVERHRAGEAIPDSDHLHTRYTVDGTESEDDWWTFQLDGYGTWLWALGAHAARHEHSVLPYAAGVAVSVRYLAEFWKEPCYDWWEEHRFERHTSTLGAIRAGLAAAAEWDAMPDDLRGQARTAATDLSSLALEQGVRDGRLVKWLNGDDVDASLLACATPFGLIAPDGPIADATVREVERRLAHGGVHRYPADVYYGGGEWLLLAGLLGWHYAAVGRTAEAERQLLWIADHATAAGELPEQVDDHLLHPERQAEWTRRWGPVATPLLWSHAMFLTLALELGVVASPVLPEVAVTPR